MMTHWVKSISYKTDAMIPR